MAENHELRVSVDSTGAERGLKRYDAALQRSITATRAFDATARTAFSNLSRVAAGNNGAAALSRAMNFRAPSITAVRNVDALGKALAGLRVAPGTAQALGAVTAAASSFRAPSIAQVRNLERLLLVLQTANPARIAAVARALAPLRGFNVGGIGRIASGGGGVSSGALNLGASTAALGSFNNQLASGTRLFNLWTASILGFSAASFIASVNAAGRAAFSFNKMLLTFSTSDAEFKSHQAFIDLLTTDLPVGLRTARTEYAKFATAARFAGLTADETQRTFKGFITAFTVLGTSNEDQELALLGLSQAFSKNRLQAEELIKQIGSRIPGAVQMLASSMGIATGELFKLMRAGQVSPTVLLGLADRLQETYGQRLPAALAQSQSQMTFLNTAVEKFRTTVFNSGVNSGLAAMAASLRAAFGSPEMQRLAESLGRTISNVAIAIGAVGVVAVRHADGIIKFFSAFAILAAFGTAVNILTRLNPQIMLLAGGAAVIAALPDGFQTLGLAIASLGVAIPIVGALNVQLGILMRQALLLSALGIGVFGSVGEAMKRMGVEGATGFSDMWEAMKFLNSKIDEILGGVGASIANQVGIAGELRDAFGDIAKRALDYAKAQSVLGDQFEDNARRERASIELAEEAAELASKQQALLDRLDPVGKAARSYTEQLALLTQLRDAGQATAEQFATLKQRLDETTLTERDPFAGLIKSMREEMSLLRLSGDSREIETRTLRQRNQLLEAGIVLTAEQTAALRDMNSAMLDLERGGSNGFQRWANGVKDLREALIDVEVNAVDGLADALTDLVTDGQADFISLGRTILRELNRALIRSLLQDVFGGMSGPGLLSGLFGSRPSAETALANADRVAKLTPPVPILPDAVQTMNVAAANVIINPAGFGGTGLATPSGPLGTFGRPAEGAEGGSWGWGLPSDKFAIDKPNTAPFKVIPVKPGDSAIVIGGSGGGVGSLGTGGLSFDERWNAPFVRDTIDSLPTLTVREFESRWGDLARAGVSYGDIAAGNDPFLSLIRRAEGTAGINGYDTSLAYGALLPGGREQDLTSMTLGQIDSLQSSMLSNSANVWNSSALGAYQITQRTLRGLKETYGLDDSLLFDESMQDSLARALMIQRGANVGGLQNEWQGLLGVGSGDILSAYNASAGGMLPNVAAQLQTSLQSFGPALQSATASVTNQLVPSLTSFGGGLGVFGFGLQDASTGLTGFNSILNQIPQMFAGMGGTGGGGFAALGNMFPALFGGFRAGGGDVRPGKLYRVGEQGEEWFAPRVAGSVIPNDELPRGDGRPVVQNFHFDLPNVKAVADFGRTRRQLKARAASAMHLANQKNN